MSIRLNFCRSVPPEFLWSFFLWSQSSPALIIIIFIHHHNVLQYYHHHDQALSQWEVKSNLSIWCLRRLNQTPIIFSFIRMTGVMMTNLILELPCASVHLLVALLQVLPHLTRSPIENHLRRSHRLIAKATKHEVRAVKKCVQLEVGARPRLLDF